jgi:hypothetical protein
VRLHRPGGSGEAAAVACAGNEPSGFGRRFIRWPWQTGFRRPFELPELSARSRPVRFFSAPGDPTAGFYEVVDGIVRLVRVDRAGCEAVLLVAVAGEAHHQAHHLMMAKGEFAH